MGLSPQDCCSCRRGPSDTEFQRRIRSAPAIHWPRSLCADSNRGHLHYESTPMRTPQSPRIPRSPIQPGVKGDMHGTLRNPRAHVGTGRCCLIVDHCDWNVVASGFPWRAPRPRHLQRHCRPLHGESSLPAVPIDAPYRVGHRQLPTVRIDVRGRFNRAVSVWDSRSSPIGAQARKSPCRWGSPCRRHALRTGSSDVRLDTRRPRPSLP